MGLYPGGIPQRKSTRDGFSDPISPIRVDWRRSILTGPSLNDTNLSDRTYVPFNLTCHLVLPLSTELKSSYILLPVEHVVPPSVSTELFTKTLLKSITPFTFTQDEV